MRASLRDECEPQVAVDAIPPGGKVLHTVSGHNDTFMQVTDTHIWKLTDAPERDMLVTLTDCPELKELIPTYTREVTLEKFIGREPGKDAVVVELQDVTSGFEDPCIMDIKLGTRTFLEDEVDNPKVRADLLKKMDALDRTAATETERESVRPRPRCRRPAGALSSVPTPCPTPRGYPNPCRAASRSCATCSSVRGRARALPWAFGSRASR